jgi:hypothetical protein
VIGTRVRLLGSSVVNNSSGVADPAWECFVDGESIGHEEPFETHQNNWPLCLAPDLLEDGEHTLTLNVTTRGTPFYLDQVRILPSLDVSEHQLNATVVVEQSDLALSFSDEEQWPASNGSIRSTTTDGASFSMNFTGALNPSIIHERELTLWCRYQTVFLWLDALWTTHRSPSRVFHR